MIEAHNLTKNLQGQEARRHHRCGPGVLYCRPADLRFARRQWRGKTTTLRMLAPAQTNQRFLLLGRHDAATARIGARQCRFSRRSTALYGRLTAREMITYFGTSTA